MGLALGGSAKPIDRLARLQICKERVSRRREAPYDLVLCSRIRRPVSSERFAEAPCSQAIPT